MSTLVFVLEMLIAVYLVMILVSMGIRNTRVKRTKGSAWNTSLAPILLFTEHWRKWAHFFDWRTVDQRAPFFSRLSEDSALKLAGDPALSKIVGIVANFVVLNFSRQAVYQLSITNPQGAPCFFVSMYTNGKSVDIQYCAVILRRDVALMVRQEPQSVFVVDCYTNQLLPVHLVGRTTRRQLPKQVILI